MRARLTPFRRVPETPVRSSPAAFRSQAAKAAKRAWRQLALLIPLLVGLMIAYRYRERFFGLDTEVRIATAVALMAIGFSIARQLGRVVQPRITNHMDPAAAGVAGWIVSLIGLLITAIVSLRIAGLDLGTLTLGASFTAVIVGLAAQQTFGNVFAGLVLLAARPFQIGDRVRFSGFGMDVEADVKAYGLLYVTCQDGADDVLVPNSTALTMSVRPIKEPDAVDLKARLPLGTDPESVQARVAEAISVSTTAEPDVELEEFDDEHVVVRIRAAPTDPPEGAQLAREVLGAVAAMRNGQQPQPNPA